MINSGLWDMMYYIDWLASTLPQKGSTTISRKKHSAQHTWFYPQNGDWMVCVVYLHCQMVPSGPKRFLQQQRLRSNTVNQTSLDQHISDIPGTSMDFTARNSEKSNDAPTLRCGENSRIWDHGATIGHVSSTIPCFGGHRILTYQMTMFTCTVYTCVYRPSSDPQNDKLWVISPIVQTHYPPVDEHCCGSWPTYRSLIMAALITLDN